ncbi:MAG: hypothetical protein AAF490_07160 [Chloroflexota bacterium]
MSKVLFIVLLLLILLAAACRGRSAGWQPASTTPPQFEEQPHLLLQANRDNGRFSRLTFGENELNEFPLERAPSLGPLLSTDYQVLDDIIIGQEGRYIDLPNGISSPNGLWLTGADAEGLHLFRIDGGRMLLSENGRFPVWSFDSKWLAFADDDGLWAVEIDTLTSQQLSNSTAEPLAWSDNNQQLLLRDAETALIFDIDTKSEQILRGVNAAQIHDLPVWSADGNTIYARYGNNGNTDAVPKKIQGRLVAIDVSNGRSSLRDLLPNVRNQGITTFLPSPDRTVLLVRHHVCRNEFGGLFPFIPTRKCDDSHLLVEAATGHYQTLPTLPPNIVLTWERPFPAVTLADLPVLPTATSPTADTSSLPNGTAFWQPTAALGHNPATAVPLGQSQSNGAGKKLLTIVDILLGDEALALALNANGSPPFSGYTYIAVRQRVGSEAGRSSIFITPRTRLVDTQLVAHQEILWLNSDGQVITELEYSDDAPAEYWQVFAVAENATPWLLFASAGVADNLPDLYFRLDENPDWEMPASADPLPANTVGVTEPASAGETAVSSDWQITVLGDDASELAAANDSLIKIQIVYTGAAPSASRLFTCLSDKNFSGIAATQIGQRSNFPDQPFQSLYHEPCLLPGAVYEGWITAVSGTDESVAFRFAPPNRPGDPFSNRTFEK